MENEKGAVGQDHQFSGFRFLGSHEGLRQSGNSLLLTIAAITALFGFALRIVVLFVSGNREVGAFSGVGDQIRYLTLADSISKG